MVNKRVLVPAVLALVIAGSIVGSSRVYAQTANPTPSSGFLTNLVQMLSQRFNLNQSDVQSVVNQFHEQKRTERRQKMDQKEQNRLAKLVQEGKITDAQKQAILSKLNELKGKYNPDNLKSLTPEQRKEQMVNYQNELKNWAQSQNIDLNLVIGIGKGHMMGRKMGWGK